MKEYIKKDKFKGNKSKATKSLINETLFILDALGIPVNGTPRRLECMAMAFLACSNIKSKKDFQKAKSLKDEYHLKSRDVVDFVNKHFKESISRGSYDDIRRKDLKFLTLADIILESNPEASKNSPTRGFGLNPDYIEVIQSYGTKSWDKNLKSINSASKSLKEKLERKREISKVKVTLPSGLELKLSKGEHNDLQKAIIQEFLPRYGFESEVLYLGDTSKKYLHLNEEALKELGFFKISDDLLPDILAYSSTKNWLYLIEAYHSTGQISETKLLQFKEMTKSCKAEIIYVTAFLDRDSFRKVASTIAWETEVWIADNPDHLIHFNGDKFLGPYKEE